ncbi:MAG: thioredoxin family protein [Planctomycetaceae bacterium]|nr:thioredoxin family protein [Planctomycetaceae bacterium]
MQSLRFVVTTAVTTIALTWASPSQAEMGTSQKNTSLPKSGWHTSYSQAESEAKALGKPLLVHFYADWCGPCQKMERSVLNQSEVLNCLGKDVVGVKVNADHHPDLKNRFGISGFPSDVLVSPTGEVSSRYVGYASESSYVARLKNEGAKYPSQPTTQLANQPNKSATKELRTIGKTKHLGLEGYSPVALTTGKLWKKGKPEFAARFRGIIYQFSTAEELDLFLDSPTDYAPKLLGCDPVILAKSGKAVRGGIEHGVFFRKRVYLMATDANREEFLKNAAYYADKNFAVEADQIEQLVSR